MALELGEEVYLATARWVVAMDVESSRHLSDVARKHHSPYAFALGTVRLAIDACDQAPDIVDAALRIKAQSFLIDGEAVIARDDGTPDFKALRSKHRGHGAVLFAFDLIGHDGNDLRDLPVVPQFEILVCRILRGKLLLLRSNWRIF